MLDSVVTSGKRRFMRNDFMGNAYNEAVDTMKKELSQMARDQIQGGTMTGDGRPIAFSSAAEQ